MYIKFTNRSINNADHYIHLLQSEIVDHSCAAPRYPMQLLSSHVSNINIFGAYVLYNVLL